MSTVTSNLYGMENALIWLFKELSCKVFNPCRVLYVHHHHRVAIREGDREKVNNKSNIGHASFTFELE